MAFVSISDEGGVSVLAIDRPPANAMDVDLLGELVSSLASVAADPPNALVIAGRPGFFSAGVDLKAAPSYGPEEQRRMVESINGSHEAGAPAAMRAAAMTCEAFPDTAAPPPPVDMTSFDAACFSAAIREAWERL